MAPRRRPQVFQEEEAPPPYEPIQEEEAPQELVIPFPNLIVLQALSEAEHEIDFSGVSTESKIHFVQEVATRCVWSEIHKNGATTQEEYEAEISEAEPVCVMYDLIDCISDDDKNEMLDYVGREHALNIATATMINYPPDERDETDEEWLLRETVYWWLRHTDMWSYDAYSAWSNSQ